ncbi:hypothetical protein V8F33_001898 [Rhypophila sp. PSN 637]
MDAEEFARTAPGQPLVTGPPNPPIDQADPMDMETDPMDTETDPMDTETDPMDTEKKRPLAFEALPQKVLDRISGWLTGADAKQLCLTSKALYKAFAHRKWTSVSLDQSLFTSDAWSTAFRNQIHPNDGLETDSSLPIAHYVRELNLNNRGLEDYDQRPLEPWTEYENRVAWVLDVVSAAENLQYLELHVLALMKWTGPIRSVTDTYESWPAELRRFRRPQTTWESIRFVNLYWDERNHRWFNTDTIKLPHQIITKYVPNLMALQLHLKFFGFHVIVQSPFYKSMARRYGGTLKRMYLHYCDQERHDAWTFQAPDTDVNDRWHRCFELNLAALDRISRDFKGLEWLAIQGTPVSGEGNGRILVRPLNKKADACIESLKRFNRLKRLVLEFYQDTSAQGRLAYHSPARKGEEDTYILRNIQFARRLLAGLPSLEEIYLFSANATYVRFDCDLITRMGDSNSPDFVTWGHADKFPAGVWPLGNKREAGDFL